jgi:GDP-L-fucose synthase
MDKNIRITITGGKGFLGQYLLRNLEGKGYENLAIADLPEYNLVNLTEVRRMYDDLKPDVVIHLAAKVGGIGFNQENPATLFYENLMMGVQLLHEGSLRKIGKFVGLGTICAYPKFTPVPFREDDIWNGYPEETNAPYGLAKKMMLVQSQAYRQQYGFNSIFLLPVNLYGPGDNFSFKSSHVIPALVRKFKLAGLLGSADFGAIVQDFLRNGDNQVSTEGPVREIGEGSSQNEILAILRHYGIYLSRDAAGDPIRPADVTVEIWGTGQATREFFYVEDAAEAIVLATERYNRSEPVNIGAGFEISIKDLVGLIVELTGFSGTLAWDTTKPDGQPRRMLDTSRAKEEFNFESRTSFREGLRKVIDWYSGIRVD